MDPALYGLAGVVIGGIIGAGGQVVAERLRQHGESRREARRIREKIYIDALGVVHDFVYNMYLYILYRGALSEPSMATEVKAVMDASDELTPELRRYAILAEAMGNKELGQHIDKLAGSPLILLADGVGPASVDVRALVDEHRNAIIRLIARDMGFAS
ncbi:hypothetical protein FE251_06745 [Georgenia wutianyii]|uniref:Uncharacterized protein n=1 Tax=Georgenia wutianyii TaxID=2585135 RepID=A0ABX5VQR6_9MICO|nr:hypothetical protein [Georgenia wutianyii]QDB79100.1 hypothetical protein FE251_06745 [Georgenia wutianyii]